MPERRSHPWALLVWHTVVGCGRPDVQSVRVPPEGLIGWCGVGTVALASNEFAAGLGRLDPVSVQVCRLTSCVNNAEFQQTENSRVIN